MNNLLAEQIIQDMNNLLAESHWRNRKAVEIIGKPLKKIFSDFLEIRKPLKKIKFWASRWRNRKAVEEIGKPLKKIFSDFLEIEKPLNRWRKSNFERGKFGVSFWHQIFDHVRAWIYLIGFSVFQLLIILQIITSAFDTYNLKIIFYGTPGFELQPLHSTSKF